MQIDPSLIKDACKGSATKNPWLSSLVFMVELKLEYGPVIFGHDYRPIAARMKCSESKVRRHFNILMKEELIIKQPNSYRLSRLRDRKKRWLSTIKFKKGMTGTEIKQLLRAKVVLQNIVHQGFMKKLRSDDEAISMGNMRISLKGLKSHLRKRKKYGVTSSSEVNQETVLSDRRLGELLGVCRKTANSIKRNLSQLGLISYERRKEKVFEGITDRKMMASIMDTYSNIFFHKGSLYRCTSVYMPLEKDMVSLSSCL